MELAYFTADGADLVPTVVATSGWSKQQMHGVATCSALAREVERTVLALGRDDLRPARFTVDMFRPAGMVPSRTCSTVVREGARLCLVDATLTQDGTPMARASAVFLKHTETPAGEVWVPAQQPAPPPVDVAPPGEEPHVPFILSAAGWSQDFGEHHDGTPKSSWSTMPAVVAGERPSPFQAVAGMCDGANMVTNWGSEGIQFINTDATLTLARLPRTTEVGLTTIDRSEAQGIAVCAATVYDREGRIGNVVITSIANSGRTVDFEGITYDDDGTVTTR
jgi:hypothetical protein